MSSPRIYNWYTTDIYLIDILDIFDNDDLTYIFDILVNHEPVYPIDKFDTLDLYTWYIW